MENSTSKGDRLENQVFNLLTVLLNNSDFFLPAKTSKIFKKKGYYSKKRQKEIVFDISIETTLPGSDKYSLLTIFECKNINKSVTVDDIEEFGSKLNQIGEHNTKGVIITTQNFQISTINIAKSEGIGLVRINSKNELNWINYRKDSNRNHKFQNFLELTEETIKNEPFIASIGHRKFNNLADFLIGLSIIDFFVDKEEFIEIPFVTHERLNFIINKLQNYNLYDNNGALNTEKLIAFLKSKYEVDFLFDSKEVDKYLGKIEFDPCIIKIPKEYNMDKNRWRFTLAHEVGHLILHKKLLQERLKEKSDDENTISLKYSFSSKSSLRLEYQANLFASYLLLPEFIIVPVIKNILKKYNMHHDYLYLDYQKINQSEVLEILYGLSEIFQVSVTTLKLRLIKLNLLVDTTDNRIGRYLRNYFKKTF